MTRIVKTVLAVIAALVLWGVPAQAQPLPDAACTTLKQLGAKFGSLNKGSDDDRRRFALMVAQQFAFSLPNQGWGTKSAGPGRPQTKDVVARQTTAGLDGWDLVDGVTREVTCTSHVELPGQNFIAVTPTDHLGGIEPGGGGGSGNPLTRADFDAAIADLHTALWNEVEGEIGVVRARIEKLEGGSGSGSGSGTTDPDVAAQQLAVSKEILALLQKAAARFGIK